MGEILESTSFALGIGVQELAVWQMALRAAVIYIIAVAMVRLSKKRFMAQGTAFDLVLSVVLGSIISRVITASIPFFPGLAAAFALVGMHWVFSAISMRWPGFSVLVKGRPRLLVRDGEIDWAEMRSAHMTEGDLWEDLRSEGLSDLDKVAEARLERSGRVSLLKKG